MLFWGEKKKKECVDFSINLQVGLSRDSWRSLTYKNDDDDNNNK